MIEDNPWETICTSDLPGNNVQLYNLADDLSETKNVAAAAPGDRGQDAGEAQGDQNQRAEQAVSACSPGPLGVGQGEGGKVAGTLRVPSASTNITDKAQSKIDC